MKRNTFTHACCAAVLCLLTGGTVSQVSAEVLPGVFSGMDIFPDILPMNEQDFYFDISSALLFAESGIYLDDQKLTSPILKWDGSKFSEMPYVSNYPILFSDNAGNLYDTSRGFYQLKDEKWVLVDDRITMSSLLNPYVYDTVGSFFLGSGYKQIFMPKENTYYLIAQINFNELKSFMGSPYHPGHEAIVEIMDGELKIIASVDNLDNAYPYTDNNYAMDSKGNFYMAGEFEEIKTAEISGQFVGSGDSKFVGFLGDKTDPRKLLDGEVNETGTLPISYLAKWNGSEWTTLGKGVYGKVVPSDTNYIRDIAIDNHDNVYVTGSFTKAGDIDAQGIAKWNGSEWEKLNFRVPLDSSVPNLLVDIYGNVHIVGELELSNGIVEKGYFIIQGNNITSYSFSENSSGIPYEFDYNKWTNGLFFKENTDYVTYPNKQKQIEVSPPLFDESASNFIAGTDNFKDGQCTTFSLEQSPHVQIACNIAQGGDPSFQMAFGLNWRLDVMDQFLFDIVPSSITFIDTASNLPAEKCTVSEDYGYGGLYLPCLDVGDGNKYWLKMPIVPNTGTLTYTLGEFGILE